MFSTEEMEGAEGMSALKSSSSLTREPVLALLGTLMGVVTIAAGGGGVGAGGVGTGK